MASGKEMANHVTKMSKALRRDLRIALKIGGRDMVRKARSSHRFRSITGTADRSIESEVDPQALTLTFRIKPDNVTLSNGYNRTLILNSGTYGNARKGKIDPEWVGVGGKPGTGIQHDDFMGRAWEGELPRLEGKLSTIMNRYGNLI